MEPADVAALLDAARRTATPITQLSEIGITLDLDGAYAVQRLAVERRLQRGERPIGIKMGFTSRAKMAQMGVSDLIWGRLTDAMRVRNGASIALEDFIHPRAEPEIAFRLARPLAGSVTVEEARAAVDAVAPAIEVIDSRYRDFRFSLTDVVADNTSSAAFVTGRWHAPDIDLAALTLALQIDGAIVQQGPGSAILGDPWLSLVEAARLLARHGLQLEPGWIVMAGAATAAEALRPGVTVSVDAGVLGTAGFRVRPPARRATARAGS